MSAFPHIFSRTKPYAHAPISFTRVLSPDAGDKQHVLLTVWFLSMMPMIFGGLMVLRGSAIPVEIGGVDIRLTFYFPVVLCTLYALWFGYWWGAIPAFIAHATVAVAGGVGVWWALLLGVTDLLALGVLIVAYQAMPASTTLRSVGSVVFFVLTSFVAVLASSAGAFVWAFVKGLSPAETLDIWKGWWVGGLLLHLLVTAPILFVFGRRVENWKKDADLRPTRRGIMSPTRVLIAYGLAVCALVGYGFLVRYFGWGDVVTSEVLTPEVFSTLNGLSLLQWITFGFIGLAGYFGFLISKGWSKTAADLAVANELLLELLDQRELDQARLVEFAVEQEQARHARDTFFSIISHDLRGPMGSLLGLSKVAENRLGGHDDRELVEMAGLMHRSAERLYSLLINLLEWARLQAGQMRVEREHLNLSEHVDSVIGVVSGAASEKCVWLNNRVSPDTSAWADPTMLRSVLQNLIGNGLKFTEEGGSVTVRADEGNNQLTISVQDTGVGMSEEDMGRLFRIEESLSRTGTAGERGSGLGLILCKEMVERHGGTISVESLLGEGCTFRVVLPVESQNPARKSVLELAETE